ncbi:MAG: hypothetical protein ABI609_06800 [Acidobacteriota bacterium]
MIRLPRTLDRKGWRSLGLGLASVAVAAGADSSVHDRFQNDATPGNERLARDLRPLGQAGGLALIGIGWSLGKLGGGVGTRLVPEHRRRGGRFKRIFLQSRAYYRISVRR